MASRRSMLLMLGLLLAGATGLITCASTAPASGEIWTWPVPDPRIVQEFEAPTSAWGPGHRGMDLAASPGDPVLAIGAGVVAFVGSIAGKPVVSIEHTGQGLRSTYEPVLARVVVGQPVQPGTVIGTVSNRGGHCAGRCLHLGVRRIRTTQDQGPVTYLDPASLLRRWAILKPIPRR